MQKELFIIDICSGDKCTLHRAMEDGKYSITHITLSADIDFAGFPVKPDLVLFYHNNKTHYELFWESVTAIDKSIAPVVIITSSVDADFYSRLIESGADYFIQVPCRRSYFYQRLDQVMAGSRESSPGGPVDVDIDFDQNRYQASIEKKRFNRLMVSLLGNNIQQQNMLKNLKREQGSGPLSLESKDDAIALMEQRVKHALEQEHFQLYYQPVHLLETGELTGFESLIRWIDPEKGIIPPDDFIPLVEQSSAIMDLGFWIIEEGIRQVREFNQQFSFPSPLYVNINLSARQFTHPHLSETIIEKVKQYGIDHSMVNFEITEGAFMDDMEQANLMLLKLKHEGFKIYMDDFGTGYSSLTYLLHFPVDCIKVDKSFVQWMHIEEESQHIVRSVIFLAHNLKINVVTEGVELHEHIELLKEMKSDYAQGYFYSRPMPAHEAMEYIARHAT